MTKLTKFVILALAIVVVVLVARTGRDTTTGAFTDTNRFTTCDTANVSVLATSTSVLSPRSNRKYVYIENTSTVTTSTVDLFFGATALTTKGIRLGDEEIYEITPQKLWVGQLVAVGDVTTTLRYVECY